METIKLSEDKKVPLVMKVMVLDTFRGIPPGEEVHFSRQDLGNRDNTVQSAILRLNRKSGTKEFSMRIDDNDGSYWVSRKG